MRPGHVGSKTIGWLVGAGVCGVLLAGEPLRAGDGRPPRGTVSRDYSEAKALFEKLWEPGQASPSGGDGVGPLFNEQSCVGCHNLGGTGGAGDNTKNVTILSAIAEASSSHRVGSIFQGNLEDLHPAFRGHASIVLHQHSTSTTEAWRLTEIRGFDFVQTRDAMFALRKSGRSTPSLFGAGVIDRIPDTALIAAEARTFVDFPEITGRVSRLRDGRIGKFGWKGQTASLDEFVMAACANELGLEVRGRHQPSLLSDEEFRTQKTSLDLDTQDTRLLTRFVANLPRPAVRRTISASQGLAVFESIGCASCHTPGLGNVRGLYSDLLLHDLGDRTMGFGGGYGGGGSQVVENATKGNVVGDPAGEATATEWRTTPLWGVADSAPYLHDGRASTLHDAIMMHGGEAGKIRKRYETLAPRHRQALTAFLKSQVAPAEPKTKHRRT